MTTTVNSTLEQLLDKDNLVKLTNINNPELHQFVADYIQLCTPANVFVCTDSEADAAFVRQAAITNGEELPLAIDGHTIHFDSSFDQARDKARTRFLLPKGVDLGTNLNTVDKDEGLAEIRSILSKIMVGKTCFIRFFCLGPTNSPFSIPAVQITDSAYVAHSEDILYRRGYEELRRQNPKTSFFKFIHSAGELNSANTSSNIDLRRVYIDTEEGRVFSTNTQYGGNTIGLKKLAMRLAIYRAEKEGWLTEHMMLMGIHGDENQKSYVAGAFPSMCGKTSTAMIPWETMVGDDIAYLRAKDGKAFAVNVESGMFGIIMGVNETDDPLVWKVLHQPGEVIFSNVLLAENKRPYWLGMGEDIPSKGHNYSGTWSAGNTDDKGNEITPSHRNARFTVALKNLANTDPSLNDPEGVEVKALIYGGRDSDTWVPVQQAFDWQHGIITKAASLESETTAATLGKEGVRVFNPMSNLDFVSIKLGRYLEMNLEFGEKLATPPTVFGVNYFIQNKEGQFLNDKTDKGVWLKWIEQRVSGQVDAYKTPTGFIPLYNDLKALFRSVLDKDYTHEAYVDQFTIRIPEWLAKIERIKQIYTQKVTDTPELLFKVLEDERKRLGGAQEQFGDYIPPEAFAD
jgi:phosphoenolpyruvate carboxykinase (GTP)